MNTALFNRLLQDLDMTLTAAAAFLGVSRRTVGYWIEKDTVPDAAVMTLAFLKYCGSSANQVRQISGLDAITGNFMLASEHQAHFGKKAPPGLEAPSV